MRAGEEHNREDGTPCPYLAANGICNKCGWTVDLLGALEQSILRAREDRRG